MARKSWARSRWVDCSIRWGALLLVLLAMPRGLSAQLLSAPTLSSPASGATGVSTAPSFSWSSVTGANRYWLTVATSSSTLPTDPNAISCPSCVISCTTTGTSHTAGSSCTTGQSQVLGVGTTYFWRVQGWNTNGTQGNYSGTRSFATQSGGVPDIRISPLSLTFATSNRAAAGKAGQRTSGSGPLDLLPDARADAEFPPVISRELTVELANPARFRALQGLAATADGLRLVAGAPEGSAESVPLAAPAPFTAVGARWTSSTVEGGWSVAFRYSQDGIDWSPWVEAPVDEHLSDPSSRQFFATLSQVKGGARFIQASVRARRQAAPSVLKSLALVLIDPGPTPVAVLARLKSAAQPPVLSRTQWGCPDGESSPLWPPAYTTVTHLIIHHTDTSSSAVDWPAEVRSIWSYHTTTRGWGDIGYNYLIDPTGVIYEGRAGGTDAIGAHFSCQNSHTQGVALLGTYTSTTPTAAALQSLKTLLAWIASREGIDPTAVVFHPGTQLDLQTLSGHRDGNPSTQVCNTTTCPGNSLYGLLPGLRADVAALLAGTGSGQSFTIFNDGTAPLSVTSLQLQTAGPWIQWTPGAPFTVPAGGSQQVTVTVDASAAPAGSSTRRLLVSSNDPDESPYPGGVDIVVNRPTPACYPLTLAHTGTGGNPAASPSGSTGCPTAQYTAGASIQLSASPAAGWVVAGWSGTDNDGSTSSNNSLTMPAAGQMVAVTYVQAPAACFALALTHAGSGDELAASPPNSAGCSAGRYSAGESIELTANPAGSWRVEGWSGTVDDGATATTNTVVMPASDHAASVSYVQVSPTCYALSLSHTGTGSDPSAWPASSSTCAPGHYLAGSWVELTASPAAGWTVGGWSGTDDDASHSTTNSVTLPASDVVVSVSYVQSTATCYPLTRSHTGQGADPSASPASSAGCPAGQYAAGQAIQLTASPSAGWKVRSWSGTSRDGSTAATNSLTMQASASAVSVAYMQAPAAPSLKFYTLAPCRLADTRSGPPANSGVVYGLQFTGTCGIPSAAIAVAANVTVVGATGAGFLTLWPADQANPGTSTLNFRQSQIKANNAVVRLATDGRGDIKYMPSIAGNGSVHVIVDVAGYFGP